MLALCTLLNRPLQADDAEPIRIAVFDFELDDRSAGGGIIEPDAVDLENLAKSGEQARRLLEASGRYSLVDASGAEDALAAAGGIGHCKGCEAALAKALGAERSMAGLIARVARTEYTIQIVVRDAHTGEILSNDFTGLRLGANYSWPRGVKQLVKTQVLPATDAE